MSVSGLLLSVCIFFYLFCSSSAWVGNTPEQIRVFFGSSINEYVISWITNSTTSSIIHYGLSATTLTNTSTGASASSFTEKSCKTTRLIHSASLSVSDPRPTQIFYQVESDGILSDILSFTPIPANIPTTPVPSDRPLKFVLFGDFGFENNVTIYQALYNLAQKGEVDFIAHIGDIAYNIDDNCNQVGDDFFNRIQPLASSTPYMLGVGNHETDHFYDYSSYTNRMAPQMTMAAASGSPSPRWYSFNVGQVHVVVFDTDAWVYIPVFPLAPGQYAWLEKDLAAVDRSKYPWIVVLGHRAMYCTKTTDGECNGEAIAIRYGIIDNKFYGIEQLLLKYGADFYLAGHTHHSEITYPVVQGRETQYDYNNPKGPVHAQIGAAGVGDGHDPFDVPQESWERIRDYTWQRTFIKVTLYNSTHFTADTITQDGVLLDSFTIVQTNHGPFVNSSYKTADKLKINMKDFVEQQKNIKKPWHPRT
jgi:predicted MPP superfamily phosphohydrolase